MNPAEIVKQISSTISDLKPGERVRFPSGTVYTKAEDGSLRSGVKKLNKKERRKARQQARKEATA